MGTRAARLAQRFRNDLLVTARRDRALYAVAMTALLSGFAMAPLTGIRPDWASAADLGGWLLMTGSVMALALLGWRLGWLALVARSCAPARDLARWVGGWAGRDGLAANAVHTLAVFVIFAAGFAVLKGAIAVVAPFAWDSALAEADRVLHFGRYPHEWLQPLLRRPWIVAGVNFAYGLWFALLVAGFIAACSDRDPRLRHQYLMSFMLVWFVGGFLIAMAVSSAGPAYFERIGLGAAYAPLMERLAAADAEHTIWALEIQDRLWAGFTGASPGSAGISAFPSMHVATATLFVLAARRIGRGLYLASLGFWLVIMAGSVLLAWHYAVDGYAGALIAGLAWRVAGWQNRPARAPEPAAAEA